MKQMDSMLFQQSQSIDEIKNRLNCIETGSFSSGLTGLSGLSSGLDLEQLKPALMCDDGFVSGIVDNIMNNSNLSEIIEQIDVVQAENRELRELLHAQQKTINEINIMMLKIFSRGINAPAPAPVSSVPPTVQPVSSVPASSVPVSSVPVEPESAPVAEPESASVAEPESAPVAEPVPVPTVEPTVESIQLDIVEGSNMQAVD